jgi:Flp pilus assembly protein TadB
MKLDKSLARTLLISFGVVSFVIGVYQTILQKDLGGNYWIFMISLACWLPLNYWRLQEARRAKELEVAQQVAALNRPSKQKKKAPRR